MNHGLASKIGWVALPSHLSLEYPTSDKRNRNPNWTDSEIVRFLTILMEEPVLNDLNAQRNKQVKYETSLLSVLMLVAAGRSSATSAGRWRGRAARRPGTSAGSN